MIGGRSSCNEQKYGKITLVDTFHLIFIVLRANVNILPSLSAQLKNNWLLVVSEMGEARCQLGLAGQCLSVLLISCRITCDEDWTWRGSAEFQFQTRFVWMMLGRASLVMILVPEETVKPVYTGEHHLVCITSQPQQNIEEMWFSCSVYIVG